MTNIEDDLSSIKLQLRHIQIDQEKTDEEIAKLKQQILHMYEYVIIIARTIDKITECN